MSVLDSRISNQFYRLGSNSPVKVVDASELSQNTTPILIKRMVIDGLVRENVKATIHDIRTTLGAFQDKPVDGILGMSFLEDTQILLDLKMRNIAWQTEPCLGMKEVPLKFGKDGIPYAILNLFGREVMAAVDTGFLGGMSFPQKYKPNLKGQKTISSGTYFGGSNQGTEIIIDQIMWGNYQWQNAPVTFEQNDGDALIGSSVWSCNPVWFDFSKGNPRMKLTLDEEGYLPFDKAAHRRLPLAWRRDEAGQKLYIAHVKAGGRMEKAGCQVGDQLIKVGELSGENLKRRAVQDLVASGIAHDWLVLRKDNVVRLTFVATDH
ncbi:hypothetical protein METESE_03830 [Mesoterricola sediminis]|uniref:PDZ domain-containing protein n=1 Tax=Mesoterricola sediminis TaxID=2927980 RepID=A0AA48KBT9_9BACT|nr:hypothetical protein [Mesoterricola sediminis]BDU75425.1 hypothetical protein METESE_03830 [Mesoterricola sediminis]